MMHQQRVSRSGSALTKRDVGERRLASTAGVRAEGKHFQHML